MPSSLRPDLQQLCTLISSPQVISWSYGKPSSLYPPSVCRSCSFLSISTTPGYKPTLSQFHHHYPNCPLIFVSEIHSCTAVLKCELSGFCFKLIKLTLLPWFACYWFFLTPQTLVSSPLRTHGTQTFLHCASGFTLYYWAMFTSWLPHHSGVTHKELRCVCLTCCCVSLPIAPTRALSLFLSLAIIFLYLAIVWSDKYLNKDNACYFSSTLSPGTPLQGLTAGSVPRACPACCNRLGLHTASLQLPLSTLVYRMVVNLTEKVLT